MNTLPESWIGKKEEIFSFLYFLEKISVLISINTRIPSLQRSTLYGALYNVLQVNSHFFFMYHQIILIISFDLGFGSSTIFIQNSPFSSMQ